MEEIWGESSPSILWSLQIRIKKKVLPVLGRKRKIETLSIWNYLKTDWRLWNFGAWCRDPGFLPTLVTGSFCAPGLLSPRAVVPVVTATAGPQAFFPLSVPEHPATTVSHQLLWANPCFHLLTADGWYASTDACLNHSYCSLLLKTYHSSGDHWDVSFILFFFN